jgi:hypothetical protein
MRESLLRGGTYVSDFQGAIATVSFLHSRGRASLFLIPLSRKIRQLYIAKWGGGKCAILGFANQLLSLFFRQDGDCL